MTCILFVVVEIEEKRSKHVLFILLNLTSSLWYDQCCNTFLVHSEKDKQVFEAWHRHDDAEEYFCEIDGEWNVLCCFNPDSISIYMQASVCFQSSP